MKIPVKVYEKVDEPRVLSEYHRQYFSFEFLNGNHYLVMLFKDGIVQKVTK